MTAQDILEYLAQGWVLLERRNPQAETDFYLLSQQTNTVNFGRVPRYLLPHESGKEALAAMNTPHWLAALAVNEYYYRLPQEEQEKYKPRLLPLPEDKFLPGSTPKIFPGGVRLYFGGEPLPEPFQVYSTDSTAMENVTTMEKAIAIVKFSTESKDIAPIVAELLTTATITLNILAEADKWRQAATTTGAMRFFH